MHGFVRRSLCARTARTRRAHASNTDCSVLERTGRRLLHLRSTGCRFLHTRCHRMQIAPHSMPPAADCSTADGLARRNRARVTPIRDPDRAASSHLDRNPAERVEARISPLLQRQLEEPRSGCRLLHFPVATPTQPQSSHRSLGISSRSSSERRSSADFAAPIRRSSEPAPNRRSLCASAAAFLRRPPSAQHGSDPLLREDRRRSLGGTRGRNPLAKIASLDNASRPEGHRRIPFGDPTTAHLIEITCCSPLSQQSRSPSHPRSAAGDVALSSFAARSDQTSFEIRRPVVRPLSRPHLRTSFEVRTARSQSSCEACFPPASAILSMKIRVRPSQRSSSLSKLAAAHHGQRSFSSLEEGIICRIAARTILFRRSPPHLRQHDSSDHLAMILFSHAPESLRSRSSFDDRA